MIKGGERKKAEEGKGGKRKSIKDNMADADTKACEEMKGRDET